MTFIKAHFDGKVFVPDSPVNLPNGFELEIPIPVESTKSSNSSLPLKELADALGKLPHNKEWPEDGAAQHDHYLYGTPKKP